MRTILASDSRLNTADNQGLVMSLEASLRPRKGVPGSIEAVMDDLVEMYGFGSLEWHRRPAPYLKVIEMGFDAVPQLINHLDDIRLTRYSQQMGYQPFPETPWEIKTIAREILEGIGCNIGKGEIQEQKLRGRQWLREVSKLGEERFFLERSLPSGTWPDEYSLWILRARFPRRLPDIYRKLLEERPEMESWMVADQIAECDLPLNEKLELFHRAARHKLPRHRLAALSELRMLSPQTYSELLLEELSNLPATPSLPYGKGDEAGCVWLVEHTDDSRAWEALLTATRRADVGFRIEILHQVIDVDYFAKQEKRLEFLSAFLDDDGVRDTTKDPAQFQGYAADMEYPRLEVRNLAAKRMARILGLEEYPKPTWDEREWAEFRSKVCSTYGH